jgi:hypothetical protein
MRSAHGGNAVSKPRDDAPEQLTGEPKATAFSKRNVVSFVDPATLQLRREAIQRVQASGIFGLPRFSPKLKG